MHESRPFMIIEDDDMDALLVCKVFGDLKVTNDIIHKVDGEDALQYLTDSSNQMPCVILLDMSMPRMNGLEFLKVIKADDNLKRIPVVILTTSDDEESILESYSFSVAGYIVKPVDYKEFVEAIRTISMYWALSKIPNIQKHNRYII